MFANCLHTKTWFVHVSGREIFFSLNCDKSAVGSNWNSENSQNVKNLVYCKKMGFSRRNSNFFKNAICGKCFSRKRFKWYFVMKWYFVILSTLFLRFFWQKVGRNLLFEKIETMMKKSILKKPFLPSRRHL